jgi:aminocarboxymuconate-semialdehyde decarboxylase
MIDVFCHFLPPRFLTERNRRAGPGFDTQYARYYKANRGLTDLDVRFRVLDQFPDVRQLLTIAGPNIESLTRPDDTVELARIANDELAEMVAAHPDPFG